MLSNACKYAIRSILYLGIHSNETKKIGVKIIAEELETPQPFLAKLLQQMTKSKLVSSTKGPNGGFYLSGENKQNAVWDIVKNIDGTEKFQQCFLGLSRCEDENPCPAHYIAGPFRKKILADFRDKTIEKFTTEIEASGKIISLKNFEPLKQV
jgi:Rrf2 family protein